MGISVLSENLLNGRDLAAARDAYQTRDADASKTAHTAGARAAGSRRHTLGSAHTRHCISSWYGTWRLWAAQVSQGETNPTRRPATALVARGPATYHVIMLKAAGSTAFGSIQVAPESHQSGGERVKTIVFGGLDGILTAHAVIAAAVGAKLNPSHVLALGISNVLADALSMVRRTSPSRSLSLTILTLACSRSRKPRPRPRPRPDPNPNPDRARALQRVAYSITTTSIALPGGGRVPLRAIVHQVREAGAAARGVGARQLPRGRGEHLLTY